MQHLNNSYRLAIHSAFCLILVSVLSLGCEPKYKTNSEIKPPPANPKGDAPIREKPTEERDESEPDYITVQHILIGFKGSVSGKDIRRSKAEAEKFATELFEKAKTAEDFGELVKKHTDDSYPGIYKMANFGNRGDRTDPDPSNHVFERSEMVAAFGNVGFRLDVDDVGMSDYHPFESKFGWHIIKRLK